MNKKFFFIVIYVLLSYAGIIYSSGLDISKVEEYEILPYKAIITKNNIHIYYTYDNNIYCLSAQLPKYKTYKKNQSKFIKLKSRSAKEINADYDNVAIIDSEISKEILTNTLNQFDISKNTGILSFIHNYEAGIYKDLNDEIVMKDIVSLPNDVDFINSNSDKQLTAKTYEYFVNSIKKHDNVNSKFLFYAKNIPNVTYMYLDTNTEMYIPLTLPNTENNKRNTSAISDSTNFFYSFVIKSHILPVIKSPFTSSYRLFSLFSTTLIDIAPASINEEEGNIPPLNTDSEPMDIEDFNAFLDEEIGKTTYKARVNYLIDGEEFFNDFILSAKKATHSIFIKMYIFKTDEYAVKFADFLKECSKHADVRVLIDILGSFVKTESNSNFSSNDFTPPGNIANYLENDSNVSVRTHPNTWLTVDHRKVLIIDRKKAYIGGMNIASEYRYAWHDMMVSLEGPIVSVLLKNFYKAWSFAGAGGDFAVLYRSIFTKSRRNINKAEPDMVDVRLLMTNPTDYQIFDAQLEATKRAKQRIYIENPYLSQQSLIEELVRARRRGVDVVIILPGRNDIEILDNINLRVANYLIKNGISVYFYPGMTHVKAGLFDNWACLGSANFNNLSMFKNREINIAFSDKKLIDTLEKELFKKDIAISAEFTEPVEIPWIYYLL